MERNGRYGYKSYVEATAYYLCHNSEEISCGLNIDGALFGDYRNKILKKPFFQFSCKEHSNGQSMALLRKEAPVYMARFENMKHLGFTDFKFMVNKKSLVGTLDGDILRQVLIRGHLYFLDKYLKGLNNERLEAGCESVSTEVG